MRTTVILLICAVLLGVFIWAVKTMNIVPIPKSKLKKFSVALDWTPNTNHTGIYVALNKGWYKDEGLDVSMLPYSQSVTSDVLVATGKADVGISATEGVVSDAAAGTPVISIAAILAHNTSSLAVLSDSQIKSPKDLDGKTYGGFGASFETPVISKIIKKAGGTGNFKNVTLDVDALQALETKKVDFVWIFDGWEAVSAKLDGTSLTTFPITSFGIADYYTPVIISSPKEIAQNPQLLKKFMKATAKGYEYAVSHPKEAAEILLSTTPKGTFSSPKLVEESQAFLSNKYTDAGQEWGAQKNQFWHGYPQFMLDSGAIVDANGKPVTTMDFDKLYTNEFLPK